jgi:hypothetical protein
MIYVNDGPINDLVVGPQLRNRANFSLNYSDRYSAISSNDLKLRTSGAYKKQKGMAKAGLEEGFMELKLKLKDTVNRKVRVGELRNRSMWRRTIGYPLMMVVITALTAASLISVVKNVGQIVAGFKSLPAANQVISRAFYYPFSPLQRVQ